MHYRDYILYAHRILHEGRSTLQGKEKVQGVGIYFEIYPGSECLALPCVASVQHHSPDPTSLEKAKSTCIKRMVYWGCGSKYTAVYTGQDDGCCHFF